ncbi:MAG: hypothetical protein LBD11_07525, partial [Candidatus Peribacteria bacterium]|nr:hypothetical protein [Candidatus Peribacteria bacterium]
HSEQGEAEVKNPENSQQPVDSSLQPSVSTQNDLTDEILTAYQRAYSHDITTLAPLANATPD